MKQTSKRLIVFRIVFQLFSGFYCYYSYCCCLLPQSDVLNEARSCGEREGQGSGISALGDGSRTVNEETVGPWLWAAGRPAQDLSDAVSEVKGRWQEPGSHMHVSLGRSDLEPHGERRSVRYHEAEVDIQVLIQEPGRHLRLSIPHKKTMMLARLKQKVKSNRWSRRAAVFDVLSSSCWAMSTTWHISPTEEATKCSSNCSRSWSGAGERGRRERTGCNPPPPCPWSALERGRSRRLWEPDRPHTLVLDHRREAPSGGLLCSVCSHSPTSGVHTPPCQLKRPPPMCDII